jgi:protein-disulfide isomerase
MSESDNSKNQKKEEFLETDNPVSESESTNSPPDSGNRVWFWVFAALLVGGFIGWVIGRQSGSVPEQGSAAAAANAPIVVTTTPLAADEIVESELITGEASEAEVQTVAVGPTPASILPESDRVLGDSNAPVTIVEFSDYQCPFCRRHFQETMPLLKENFIDTGRVSYVFKDFPIASLHPLAYRLHEAARCVLDESGTDGYWQAHDLFFADAESFQVDTLEGMDAAILAAFEGASLPDVSECLQSNKYAEAVRADLSEGQSLGVNGTPAFFINGFPVSGAQPYELFEYAIGLAEEGKLQEAFAESAQAQAQAEAEATAQAAMPRDVPISDEPARGELDAPITIVEYSDYQCPFCLRHFENTMPQLQAYIDSGQLRYVFKDFPIHSIHPQAQKAHEAARCAREIGGDDMYWTMHDLLFSRQQEWAQVPVPGHEAFLKSLASEAGLSQDEFDECLDSGRYYDAVNAEVAEGVQLGVNGTPAFFINGQPLTGAQPFPVFQQAIEQMLENS